MTSYSLDWHVVLSPVKTGLAELTTVTTHFPANHEYGNESVQLVTSGEYSYFGLQALGNKGFDLVKLPSMLLGELRD